MSISTPASSVFRFTSSETGLTPLKNNAFSRILLSASWLTIARLLGDLAGVALFLAISRRLGLEPIGHYSFAFAVAAIVAGVVGLGLDEYGLREYSRLGKVERQKVFSSMMGLQIVLVAALCVIVPAYLHLTGTSAEDTQSVALITLHVLFFQFALMYFIPTFARHEMRMPAIMETICRAGAIVAAACAVAFWGAGIPTAAAFMAGGTLLLLLYSLKSAASEGVSLKPSFNLQGFRLLVSGAWPVAASTLTYSLYCRTPVLMLTALAGAVETANFATAYKLYEFGLMPVYLLGLAVFPALSRQFDQPPASFVSLAKSYLKTSILFGALLAWGLLFVVPSTLVFILGADFAATEAATRLIAVVAFLAAIDLAFLRISLALHLQQLRLRIQVAAMVVNFAAGFALIPQFGALGAIASFIIAQLVMIGLYLRALVSLPQCAGLARTALLGAAISGSALATGAVAVQRSLPEWTVAGLTLAVLAAALFGGGFIPWQQLRGRALR